MGARAGALVKSAIDNVFIGHYAGEGFEGTGVTGGYNVFIGEQAGRHIVGGSKNVFMGNEAGLKNVEGFQNVFIGYQAGRDNIGDGSMYNGNYQVFIGYQAGLENENGQSNVYIGEQSGKSNPSGVYNTYVGKTTGYKMTAGKWNVMVGAQAGELKTSGESNVQVGNHAGSKTESGNENVFLGFKAGYNMGGVDGGTHEISRNVCVGFETGFDGIGTGNVLIGYKAGRSLVHNSSSGNVMIGNAAGLNYSGSNALFIDNSSDATPLIYGDFANDDLTINGDLTVNDDNGATLELKSSAENPSLIFNGEDGTAGTDNYTVVYKEAGVYKASFGWQSYNDYFFLYEGGDNSFVSKGGKIGIGTTSPDYKLQVNGDVVPESNGVYDLGTSGLNWGIVYGGTYNKKNANYYTKTELVDMINNVSFVVDKEGKLSPNGLPKELKNDEFIKTGETSVYNLQLNKVQQNQIDQLEKQVEYLQKENKELREMIEKVLEERK